MTMIMTSANVIIYDYDYYFLEWCNKVSILMTGGLSSISFKVISSNKNVSQWN